MSLIAVTREVSPRIGECELSFRSREVIDCCKAAAQHQTYCDSLAALGAKIISLGAESSLPDSVFVEDTAVVLEEVAIIAKMGAVSRHAETVAISQALSPYRPLHFMTPPATLDGGDVLQVGRTLFVGLSRRTNQAAVQQLSELLSAYNYQVQAVAVGNCLHLKSACSYLGRNTVLVNRSLIETEWLHGFEVLDVPVDESEAANVLLVNGEIIMPTNFPQTRDLLEQRSFATHPVELSELQKAEAGVSCCSLIFEDVSRQ